MKKYLLWNLFLCFLFFACNSNDHVDLPEPPAPCGEMIIEGVSYDMHYATVQQWSEANDFDRKDSSLNRDDFNFYRIQLASNDNQSFVQLDIYTVEESLQSGEYYTFEPAISRIGDYVEGKFRIVATSPDPFPGVTFDPPLPTYRLVFENKGDGNYQIQLLGLPKDSSIKWEGKLFVK